MKQTRILMGMPITVDIVDASATDDAMEKVYAFFDAVDQRFSTYKETSEISQINKGLLSEDDYSDDMKTVFRLSEETKQLTHGYFDIRRPDGSIDPSGLVKGWAIQHAAEILERDGFQNFCVEAGGDLQVKGTNANGQPWRIGIRNPFSTKEIVKIVTLQNCGMATSGTYIRGQHIYNPLTGEQTFTDIVSLTVIGPNVYEADRFATAAFAMGRQGIAFIEQLKGCEGYAIDSTGMATMTSGFSTYVS